MSVSECFLSIIIPSYNEETRLPKTLELIIQYFKQQPYKSEILVVDDGSDDQTAVIAERYPTVKVLRIEHKGKGFAVRTGVLNALGTYVLICDADLAVPIEEWAKFQHSLLNGYDIAIGSREGVGAKRLGEPWQRRLMGRIFNLIVRLVAVGGFNDTQCGFKALHRTVATNIFQHMRLYGDETRSLKGAAVTAYDVEMLFLGHTLGYQIVEIPVTWYYGAETKVNPIRDSLRNLQDVVQIRINYLRGYYKITDTR